MLDTDVLEEKRRIQDADRFPVKDLLIVKNLKKSYGDFEAVGGIHFGVKAGECFGLLGANGAGKSSTFQMLTGECTVTGGSAVIMNTNVIDNPRQVIYLYRVVQK